LLICIVSLPTENNKKKISFEFNAASKFRSI